jgi:hypothetical protein
MNIRLLRSVLVGLATILAAGCTVSGPARAADGEPRLPEARVGTRFDFEVIESFDAAYLGDTPGHIGRMGGLTIRPNVALGDGVYRTRGEVTERIGAITRVRWERASGGLTIEFDPVPVVRIAVGDVVWIDLNPAPQGSTAD